MTDREGLTTTYVYDAINRITEIHRPNGISTYNTYNGADQITELVNSCDHCGWVVSRYTYTYDERGFITGEKAAEALAEPAWSGGLEKHDKKSAFAYRTVETERSFTYDDAGKLLSVTETEKGCGTCVYTYKYDVMGNRTEAVRTNAAGEVVESRKYVYNENNQLSEAVVCDGKTTRRIQYTYDGDGNLTREYSPTDRSLTTYTYTVENRLEAVYTGTSYSRTLQMAAAYDGDGNRVFQLNYNPEKDEDFSDYYCTYSPCDYKGTGIRLRAEGEVGPAERELLSLINASGAITDNSYELIEYINDVNREYTEVLAEQNINGTLDTAYVYGAATGTGSGRLSLDRLGGTGYYLYDPRGSVTGLTDGEGQLYQSYRYSAFGEITFGAPEHENEYTYNGESYNPNIRSQYLRARYYCVVTADFLTEDEYLGNIMEPLTLNRYNYCVGNPLNYRDPSGNKIFRDMWDEFCKWLFGDPDAPKASYLTPVPAPTPSPTPKPWLLPQIQEGNDDLYGHDSDILPAGGIGYALRAPKEWEENNAYLKEQVVNAEEKNENEMCKFVGYLAYGAKEIVEDSSQGYFKLYSGPTLSTEGEQYYFKDLYQQYAVEAYGALQSFGGSKCKPNYNGKSNYGSQTFDSAKGTLIYNGMERYAIAIGPTLQNPSYDFGEIDPLEMAYGTCADVSIVLGDVTYYIPAIIVDVKAHSAPTGIFQTGQTFTDEYVETGKTGPIVEWYVIKVDDLGNNKSSGLNRFNQIGSLIIYREERLE